jgi:nicotinate-nucleotide adenylyltransferase
MRYYRKMHKKVGIYSGTFDPVHSGHVAFAQVALQQCQLNEVVFLPESRPREKTGVTDMRHRLALLGHALANQPYMQAIELATDQFTVAETLPELQRRYPSAELVLLIGSDVVKTFSYRWEGLSTLLRATSLAIGMRAGDSLQEIAQTITNLEQELSTTIHYQLLHTSEADAASSHIRSGKAHPSQLHPASQRYIRENKLYTE